MMATFAPSRARKVARAAPAQRPPITTMSYLSGIRLPPLLPHETQLGQLSGDVVVAALLSDRPGRVKVEEDRNAELNASVGWWNQPSRQQQRSRVRAARQSLKDNRLALGDDT